MKTGRLIAGRGKRGAGSNVSGTTLVELMVAMGLFGVLSLALFGLLATYLVRVKSAERQTDLSSSIQEFQEFVDADLGNATQLIQCGCGKTGSNCAYADSSDSKCTATVSGSTGSIVNCASELLLYYETETSQYPIAASSPLAGACLQPTWSSPMPIARGCKQRRILRFKAPNPSLDRPGELQLLADNASSLAGALGSASLDALPVLARIPGVYEVNCGLVQGPETSSSSTPPPNLFRIEARAKSKLNTAPRNSAEWEGWVSTQTGFANGVHREIAVFSEFRNLTVPGVHFGRLQSARNCLADGEYDTTGTGNCCSGYMSVKNQCLPMDECLPTGTPSDDSAFFQCCSHKTYDGSCA